MINTTRLRCTIGWLGMLLPWIVAALLWAIPSSISATYYNPRTIAPFLIILGSASFLLISYKGYDLHDDIINSLAGLLGLLVCLFPCYADLPLVGTFQLAPNTSNAIHTYAAMLFFALLAYNSFFLFTKTSGNMTANKKKRNVIYRVCGVGMLGSFIIMALPYFRIQIWLTETISLFFFAISFLTKADYYPWLFADEKN